MKFDRSMAHRPRTSRAVVNVAAAATVLGIVATSAVAADVPAYWLGPTSGDWTTAADWSTSPNYPNNGTPAGVTYAANISAAGATYTVTLGTNIAVDTLLLNSTAATLAQTGGTLTANGVTIGAGTYAVSSGGVLSAGTLALRGGTFSLGNGGALSGTAVTLAGGALNLSGGTLANVGVTGGDLTVLSELHVAGSLSVTAADGTSAGNVIVGGGTDVTFDGASPTLTKGTVTGTGTVYLNGTGASTPTTATIAAGGALTGTLSVFQFGEGNTLANAGTINANDAAGGTLAVYASNVVNRGLAEATNGGTLSLSPDQSLDNSAGTILAAAGSTVDLYGTFNTSTLGTINGSAGTVAIGGTANNANGTITLTATTGNLVLGGTLGGGAGTILGGTVAQTGGATLNVSNGVLSAVRVTGADLTVGPSGALQIRNGITVDTGRLNLSTAADLELDDQNATLDNLTVTATGSYATILVNLNGSAAGPGTATLGPHGALVGPLSVQEFTAGNTLLNQGTINADATTTSGTALQILTSYFSNAGLAEATGGGTLNISPTIGWNNAGGSIVASGGGTVNLGGTFPTAGLAINGSGGTVVINGAANNSGGTLTITAMTGNLVLGGGSATASVNGGTIAQTGTATLNVSGGTLAGVTVAGPSVAVGQGGGLTVTGGITGSASGAVTLGSAATLTFPAAAGSQAMTALTVTGTTVASPASVSIGAGLTQSATAAFTGALGVSVTGSGTTVLAGRNTYTGGTAITPASKSTATVRADNAAGSLGTGKTTINAGGVLAGIGTTGGTVEVVAKGTVTGGTGATATATVGTLTTGAETWDGGGTLYVKVNTGTVAGTAASPSASNPSADRLVMSGLTVAATAGTPFVVNVVGLGTSPTQLAPGGELILATIQKGTAGSITAVLGKLSLSTTNVTVPANARLAEDDVGTDVDLVLTAAPEPTSLLLAGAAAVPLAVGRRRRRRTALSR